MRTVKITPGPLLVALLVLLPGCLSIASSEMPPAQSSTPSESGSIREPLRFADVAWEPQQPPSGEAITVTASVLGDGAADEYSCLAKITKDGTHGGGASLIVPLSRQPDGRYACTIRSGVQSDAVGLVLVGFDGDRPFRSEPTFIEYEGGPGEGRPPSQIASVSLSEADRGEAPGVVVMLESSAAESAVMDTNTFLGYWVLPQDVRHLVQAGVLLERDSAGAYRGVLSDILKVEPDVGPDYVVIAFATTTNRLHGHDRFGFVERGYGACSTVACVRA